MQQVAVAVTVRGEADRELAHAALSKWYVMLLTAAAAASEQAHLQSCYPGTAMRQLHCSRASLLGATVMNYGGVDIVAAFSFRDMPTHLFSFDHVSAV